MERVRWRKVVKGKGMEGWECCELNEGLPAED
jgi:hypothetical protein